MSLFASLSSVSETMRAFERALSVTQNNVANASTPGFARQEQAFLARRFNLREGLVGGVDSGAVVSSRNGYAEKGVWQEQHRASFFSQRRASLESIEPVLTIREDAGVPAALNDLFSAFSELTVSPNSTVLRQNAIEQARQVALRFREASDGLAHGAVNANGQLETAVRRINELGARIAEINATRRNNSDAVAEPGSDAALYASLEELSQIADFTVLQQSDGTVSVMLGGQSPLVIGDRQYEISLDTSGGTAILRDSASQNVTNLFQSGQIGSLLDFRNQVLPSYQADLNTLAAGVADQINAQLSAGLDQNGLAPTVNLFTYNAAGAAASLGVNSLAPQDLALASTSAPGGNGNAVVLAGMGDAPLLGGKTFTNFYSDLTARMGRDLEGARQNADTHQLLLTQSRALREDLSGVSLDEEAAKLLQFQRAYQAAAQMFKIVDEMTQTLLSIAD